VGGPKVLFLPFCDRVVVYILGYLGDDGGAEFVLHVRQQTAGIESLECRIGLLKRVLGIAVVGKSDIDTHRQLALRSITVGRDGALRQVIADDLAFQFQIAAFAKNLQPRLALIEVAQALREIIGQRGVNHRCIVREVGDRNGVGGLIVDIRAVEFIADAAALEGK